MRTFLLPLAHNNVCSKRDNVPKYYPYHLGTNDCTFAIEEMDISCSFGFRLSEDHVERGLKRPLPRLDPIVKPFVVSV